MNQLVPIFSIGDDH